jgi:hypothetical protein
MKVFLSWSGERSKAVAEAFNRWFPRMINAVEPWISTHMEKGIRGAEEMTSALEETPFGIICLTKDNLDAPWILFEAGALSKTKNARVWTFLLDIAPSDVEQPLAAFQHTVNSKEDIRKLVLTVNQRVTDQGEKSLPDTSLNEQFDDLWPKLESALTSIPDINPAAAKPGRTDRDILDEILQLIRDQQRQDSRPVPVEAPVLMREIRRPTTIMLRISAAVPDLAQRLRELPDPPWERFSVKTRTDGETRLFVRDPKLSARELSRFLASIGVRTRGAEGVFLGKHSEPLRPAE